MTAASAASGDLYASLAGYYDLDFGALDDDLGLYLGFAQRGAGPVLELGAGAGRVSLALAAAGHEVIGVDTSEAMIELARTKARELSVDARTRFVLADMRSFDLGRRFELIVVPFSSFRHLLTPGDQAATLERVRAHLAPGGLLVLDLPAWHALSWEPVPGPLQLEWTRPHPATGALVTKLTAVRPEPAAQLQHLTIIYDVRDADGVVRRVLTEMPLYTYTRRELELLFDRAGLAPAGWYGSYDLAPYDSDSRRLIAVAAPREV